MANQLINGINYSLDDTNHVVSVVALDSGKYTGAITIPSGITYNSANYSVTSIGNTAFAGCTGLTSITIPNGVTSIGNTAFVGCVGLTSITIPDSVTSIGNMAFYNCTSLEYAYIPLGVTSIGDYAFGCTNLPSITIPNSVTSIGKYAFQGCVKLTSITLGNKLTTLMNDTFQGCIDLKSIVIPDSVTSVGDRCFYNCNSIENIILSKNLLSIGDSTFENCNSLTSIILPNKLTTLGGASVFDNCTSLTSIIIPSSVTAAGDNIFLGCDNLKTMTINTAHTESPRQFMNNSVKTLILGNDFQTLSNGALSGYDNLETVILPSSIISIGYETFGYCTNLKSIIIRTVNLTNSTIQSDSFIDVTGTFYVPLESYKSFSAFSGKDVIIVPHTEYKSNTLLQWEGNSIDYEMNFDYYIKGLFTNTETGDIYLFGKKINND